MAMSKVGTSTAHSKSLCIVGGGFAGLAAAKLAASKGVHVTLFEATIQVGGRARTGWLPTCGPVELGATWFHGTQDHPVYDLAVEYGIVNERDRATHATDAAKAAAPAAVTADGGGNSSSEGSSSTTTANIQAAQAGAGSSAKWEMRACRPGAQQVLEGPELEAVLQAFEQYGMALAELEESVAAGSSSSSSAGSLGQVIRSKFDQLMSDTAAVLLPQAKHPQQQQQLAGQDHQQLPGSLDSVTKAFTEGWACRERLQRAYDGFWSTDAVGLNHMLEYEDLEGPNLPVPGGYQHLAETLAAAAAAAGAILRCSSPVQKIQWGGRDDDKVAVQLAATPAAGAAGAAATAAGDSAAGTASAGQVLLFDAVVFTASLGVLKHQGSSMFEPQLPDSKLEAIQQLEIGQVDKLFVEWPQGASAPVSAASEDAAAGMAVTARHHQPTAHTGTNTNSLPTAQQQQQESLVVATAAAIGPRKPKAQLHDIDASQPMLAQQPKHPAAAAAANANASDAEDPRASYITYCLLWPTSTEFWGSQWLLQQQPGAADTDPVYCRPQPAASSCNREHDEMQLEQRLGSLPQWLLGLHSWRYGDGPEWIKPPHNSCSSSSSSWKLQQQQQQQCHPDRAAVLWVVGRAAKLLGQLKDNDVLQHLEQLLEVFPAIPRVTCDATTTSSNSRINSSSNSSAASTTSNNSGAASTGGGLLAGCHLLRSNWCSNEYFRGSYSYPGPNATQDSADQLAAPLTTTDLPLAGSQRGGTSSTDSTAAVSSRPRLLVCFAGEATSRHHMGTVHGAYLSGIREAQRLLQAWGIEK